MTAAVSVLPMQVGSLPLEVGLVRSENSIDVARKIPLDLPLSPFCAVGFAFVFAPSIEPIGFGGDRLALDGDEPRTLAFLVVQAVFRRTAVTLMPGAAAGRFT